MCPATTEWLWWVGMATIFLMGISLGVPLGMNARRR